MSGRRERPASYYRQYRATKSAAVAARREGAAVTLPGFPAAPEPEPYEVGFALPKPPVGPVEAVAELRRWAERRLIVPDGLLAGQPFTIDEWQAEFLRDALAVQCREAALSVARKNGKSGLIAVLLLGHLCGPLCREGWRGVVASITGELAKELRNAMEALKDSSGLPIDVYASPTPGLIQGPHRTRCNFLAADKATGHGIGADLAVLDEAGLLPEAKRGLFDALLSCTSGRNGRMVCISIQGDGPMFHELLGRGDDPAVVVHQYAPEDPRCKLDDATAWHQANPGLASGIKSLSYMHDMARRAIALPDSQGNFRAYDLNLPQDPGREMICAPDDWDKCLTGEPPERDGRCVVGFDLGGSSSMCAAAAIWTGTGRLEVRGAFPGFPDLRKRGEADGVGGRYVQMESAGDLRTFPGRVTPAGEFLADFADEIGAESVIAAGADRYRRREAEQALTDARLDWPMVWRGQGASATADGSHDVRAFQRAVLRGWLRCLPSLLMVHAIAESAIAKDKLGNPSLDKSRERARIDALSAAVIACGLSEIEQRRPRRAYRSMVAGNS